VAGLRRRVYRLTQGKGRTAEVRRCVEDAVTLGSHEGNTLILHDPTVSRFHARIELVPDGFLLSDLDSTNGTFVDGLRVTGAYLPPRARIGLGEAVVSFEVEREETTLGILDGDRLGGLVGGSPGMRRLLREVQQVAPAPSTVLILGETGVGKEVVAQELHRHSPRASGPFVVVDCAGLPESLIESELFGHERGAFTGADRARAGAFEEAHGGTLFLDEIGELPLSTQAKLLRAIEARTVKRLGANEYRDVDVRLLAATHQDLARLCNQRRFREDLYFRLAVFPLRVPPLRERLEDLPLLVNSILDELGSPGVRFDDELMAVLRARRWPGNVRELRNVVQRALALGPEAVAEDHAAAPPSGPEEPFKVAKARAIESFEKAYLADLLARHRGNVAQAARAAEVDPAWIFRLVKRHGIDVNALRRR
jgi:transcriptional regulator with GAF, ATPase, and Fis domain